MVRFKQKYGITYFLYLRGLDNTLDRVLLLINEENMLPLFVQAS